MTSPIHARFQFCVDGTGAVRTMTLTRPSGLPRYEERIAKEIAAWRYKPFVAGGRAINVCTHVAFIYRQR